MSIGGGLAAIGGMYTGASNYQQAQNAQQLQMLQAALDQQQLDANKQNTADAAGVNNAIGGLGADQLANFFMGGGQNTGITPPMLGGQPPPPPGDPSQMGSPPPMPQGGQAPPGAPPGAPPMQAPPPPAPSLGGAPPAPPMAGGGGGGPPMPQGGQAPPPPPGVGAPGGQQPLGTPPMNPAVAAAMQDPFIQQAKQITDSLPPGQKALFYKNFYMPLLQQRAENQRAQQQLTLSDRRENDASLDRKATVEERYAALKEKRDEALRASEDRKLSIEERRQAAKDANDTKQIMLALLKEKETDRREEKNKPKPLTPAQLKQRDAANENIDSIKQAAGEISKLTGATGAIGRVMKANETFGQYFGSNKDAYNALAKRIDLLRQTLRPELTGSKYLTKTSEAAMDNLLPLLQPFTTKAQVMESLRQVNELVTKKNASILGDGAAPAGGAKPDPLGIR